MLRYFIKRLLILIPTIIILAILIFLIINMIPGDPVAILLGTENVSNIEEIRENLGLNQSIYQRMWYWCVNICKGDLGDSYFLGRTVMQAIKERVPVTLSLATIALLFAVIIGLPLGILASVKPNSIWDTAIMGFSLIGASIPEFFLGLILILVFSLKYRWFAVGGYKPMSEGFLIWLKYLTLPSLSLGLIQAAYFARLIRSSMLEVLNQDYILTARAKGQCEFIVVMKHALRNAILPTVTAMGMVFALLLSGAFITECLFRLPGAGSLIISSIQKRDYPVVQGALLFFSVLILIVNFVVDFLYVFIDPRVQYGKKE